MPYYKRVNLFLKQFSYWPESFREVQKYEPTLEQSEATKRSVGNVVIGFAWRLQLLNGAKNCLFGSNLWLHNHQKLFSRGLPTWWVCVLVLQSTFVGRKHKLSWEGSEVILNTYLLDSHVKIALFRFIIDSNLSEDIVPKLTYSRRRSKLPSRASLSASIQRANRRSWRSPHCSRIFSCSSRHFRSSSEVSGLKIFERTFLLISSPSCDRHLITELGFLVGEPICKMFSILVWGTYMEYALAWWFRVQWENTHCKICEWLLCVGVWSAWVLAFHLSLLMPIRLHQTVNRTSLTCEVHRLVAGYEKRPCQEIRACPNFEVT